MAAETATQTQIFDQKRDNIFAPVGTSPTTWSREAIETLPQGSNAPFEKVLLQFPGGSQDSSIEGNFHVRNEHLESSLAYRINGILLPDSLGAFGQFLDTSCLEVLLTYEHGAEVHHLISGRLALPVPLLQVARRTRDGASDRRAPVCRT